MFLIVMFVKYSNISKNKKTEPSSVQSSAFLIFSITKNCLLESFYKFLIEEDTFTDILDFYVLVCAVD